MPELRELLIDLFILGYFLSRVYWLSLQDGGLDLILECIGEE